MSNPEHEEVSPPIDSSALLIQLPPEIREAFNSLPFSIQSKFRNRVLHAIDTANNNLASGIIGGGEFPSDYKGFLRGIVGTWLHHDVEILGYQESRRCLPEIQSRMSKEWKEMGQKVAVAVDEIIDAAVTE